MENLIRESREQEDFYNLHVFPLLFDEFEAVSRRATCYSGAMIPLDYEKLRKEQKYAKVLRARYEMRIQMLESLGQCYLKMVVIEFELRKMIDFDTDTERERSPELVGKTGM